MPSDRVLAGLSISVFPNTHLTISCNFSKQSRAVRQSRPCHIAVAVCGGDNEGRAPSQIHLFDSSHCYVLKLVERRICPKVHPLFSPTIFFGRVGSWQSRVFQMSLSSIYSQTRWAMKSIQPVLGPPWGHAKDNLPRKGAKGGICIRWLNRLSWFLLTLPSNAWPTHPIS